MTRAKTLGPVLLSILLLAGSAALAERPGDPGAPVPDGITVGDFAVRVARLALDNPAERAKLTREQALLSLKRAGLRFGGSPDGSLTEGDLSDFFRQAGLQLQVSQPDRPVSAEKTGALLSTFSGYFASKGSDPARILTTLPPTHSDAQSPTPNGFEECAALATSDGVPACLTCCLTLGGTSKSCGRACGQARAGKASPSEPTP